MLIATLIFNYKYQGNYKMIFNYIRVSSLSQHTERQLVDIPCDRIFEDRVSGKDTKRPELMKLLEIVRDGDIINVHSMDRLARNLRDLLNLTEKLNKQGITIHFHKENIKLTPNGTDIYSKMLLGILGTIAEFERELIRERQRDGHALARAKGKPTGRPPAITKDQLAEIIKTIDQNPRGANYTAIAKSYGMSRQALYKYLKKAKEESQEVK